MTIYDYLFQMHGGPIHGPLLWLAEQVEAAAERGETDPHTKQTALAVYAIYLALHGSRN